MTDLRQLARDIFHESLNAVDTGEAIRQAVKFTPNGLEIIGAHLTNDSFSNGIYSISIGKAAYPMANALDEALGTRLVAGIVTGPAPASGNQPLTGRWRAFNGGHPLPNEDSLASARAAFDLLRAANTKRATVIFLISGGGSAMMELPRNPHTTLDELKEANRLLITAGPTINEINIVRRAFSAVKGGGLARQAPCADQISLIMSDTNQGDVSTVASGPTMLPSEDGPGAISIIDQYQLREKLPVSILNTILSGKTESRGEETKALRKYFILLDNSMAIEAASEAARTQGFIIEVVKDIIENPIEEGCEALLSKLLDLRRRTLPDKHVALISGGEFVCPVKGPGIGGRNLEAVLRLAMKMDSLKEINKSGPPSFVALSAGTDGIDGVSPAAGAIADEYTMERARALGLDAQSFLDRSDSYTFFEALGDAIITGPTGTNVRDLRILFAM